MVAIASGLLINSFQAAEQKAATGGAPYMEAMMKKMEELSAPGPEHKVLASMVGEWDTEARCFMAGPDTPATVTKGTCKSTMILGGRYLQEEFQGDMMGRKYVGKGLTGYDKFNRKYVNIWIDDMGTGIFMSEGTSDASGKVLTFNGKMDDPATWRESQADAARHPNPESRQTCFRDVRLGAGREQGDRDHLHPQGRLTGWTIARSGTKAVS